MAKGEAELLKVLANDRAITVAATSAKHHINAGGVSRTGIARTVPLIMAVQWITTSGPE